MFRLLLGQTVFRLVIRAAVMIDYTATVLRDYSDIRPQ